MSKRILVCGLPGSGKTTFTAALRRPDVTSYNGDQVRRGLADWDFSAEGRRRQAGRMRALADAADTPYVVLDFVCPTAALRADVAPAWTFWLDTIPASRYADTNAVWEPVAPGPTVMRIGQFLMDAQVRVLFDSLFPGLRRPNV